jgi:chromosome partitioning protein
MARSQLHQRTVYRQCTVFGQTVHNFGARAAPAISEVEMLIEEVLELLNGKKNRVRS